MPGMAGGGFSIWCTIRLGCSCGYVNERGTYIYGPHKGHKVMCRECSTQVGSVRTGSNEEIPPKAMYRPDCYVTVTVTS